MNREDDNRQANLVAVLKDVLSHLQRAEAQLDTASHYLPEDNMELDTRLADWTASVRTSIYELDAYLDGPVDEPFPQSWLEDAALASELIDDDELERWAELHRAEIFDEELLSLARA